MKIAFIGMGEAGSALIKGWGIGTHDVRAYDRKTDDEVTRVELMARYRDLQIEGALTLAEALADADVVISTVTADQANGVAKAAAPHLNQGAYFCDLNSCAPSAKANSAAAVETAGGRYVDVAVMAPVHPALNNVPCLICGPHADAIKPLMDALPMNTRIVEGDVGRASMIKMVRSVLIKGLEALTSEFMLAVTAADVADEVLPTLATNYGDFDWDAQVTYNFERAMVHGVRRAAEMEEVVKTLEDLGLPSTVTQATVGWERRIAGVPVTAPEDSKSTNARELSSKILPHVRSRF